MKFTREDVRKAYDEIDRRIHIEVRDMDLTTPEEIHDYRVTALQGLYAVFMALASNWPEVRDWTDHEEFIRGYFDEEGGEIY